MSQFSWAEKKKSVLQSVSDDPLSAPASQAQKSTNVAEPTAFDPFGASTQRSSTTRYDEETSSSSAYATARVRAAIPLMAPLQTPIQTLAPPLASPPPPLEAIHNEAPSRTAVAPSRPPPPPPRDPKPTPDPSMAEGLSEEVSLSVSEGPMEIQLEASKREIERLKAQVNENIQQRAALKKTNLELTQRLDATASTGAGGIFNSNKILDKVVNRERGELYSTRSLKQKLALLDTAIARLSPDLILTVCLFLKDTLSLDLFLKTVVSRPEAFSLYSSYASQIGDIAMQERLVQVSGNIEAAVLLLYRNALSQSESRCVSMLQQASALCQSHPTAPALSALRENIDSHHTLLSRQITVEDFDSRMASSDVPDNFFRVRPRSNIVGVSLREFVDYNCIYHYDITDSSKLSSPKGTRDLFKMSKENYCWSAMLSRAKVGDWAAVRALTAKTGFLGKEKSLIGFRPFAMSVLDHNGPREHAVHYVQLLESKEERFSLYLEYRLFAEAIDVAADLKDQDKLVELRQFLLDTLGAELSGPMRTKIDNFLSDKKIKWKSKK